jgi:hypothetical protein
MMLAQVSSVLLPPVEANLRSILNHRIIGVVQAGEADLRDESRDFFGRRHELQHRHISIHKLAALEKKALLLEVVPLGVSA